MKRHFPLAAQIAALVLAACSISFAATETRFPGRIRTPGYDAG